MDIIVLTSGLVLSAFGIAGFYKAAHKPNEETLTPEPNEEEEAATMPITATLTTPTPLAGTSPAEEGEWYTLEGTTGNGSTYTAIYHTTDYPKVKNLFRGTIDLLSIYGKKSGNEYCRYVDGWITYPLGDVKVIMEEIYNTYGYAKGGIVY